MSSTLRFGLWLGVGLFFTSLWFGWFGSRSEQVVSLPGEPPRAGASSVTVLGGGEDDATFAEEESQIAFHLFQFHQTSHASEVLNGLEGDRRRRIVVRKTFHEVCDLFPAEAELVVPADAVETPASAAPPATVGGTPPPADPKHKALARRAEFQTMLTDAVSFAKSLNDPQSRAIALSNLTKARAQIDDLQFTPVAVELAAMAATNLKPVVQTERPNRWSANFQQVFGSGLFAAFVAAMGTQLVVMIGKFRDNLLIEIAKLSASATSAFVAAARVRPTKQEERATSVESSGTG